MINTFLLLSVVLLPMLPALALLPLYARYRPMQPLPNRLASLAIVFGIAFTLPASFVQWYLPEAFAVPGISLNYTARLFVIVALPEEGIKLLAVLILRHFLIRTQGKVDSHLIFLAFLVATGFSMAENIFYLLFSHSRLYTAWLRGFTALPLHTLCAGITALGLLPSYLRPLRKMPPIMNLLLATGLHGLYNLILGEGKIYKILILLIFAWLLLLFFIHSLHKKQQS